MKRRLDCRRPMRPIVSFSWRHMLLAFLLFSFFLFDVVSANIHLRVVWDTRRVIFLGTFAFGPNGTAIIQLRNFSAPSAMFEHADNAPPRLRSTAPIGFLVEPTESAALARTHARYGRGEIGTPFMNGVLKGGAERGCFLHDPLVSSRRPGRVLLRLEGLSVEEITQHTSSLLIDRSGLYAVYFYNCADMPPGGEPTPLKRLPTRPITFTVDVRLYWMMGQRLPVFLSYADKGLPVMYDLFGCFFLVLSLLWSWQMYKHGDDVKRIHHLMLFLVIVKSCTLFIEATKLRYFANTGEGSMWDFIFYLTMTMKGVMLFGVLLLLGSGWSLLRDYLSPTDKRILLTVLPCQVLLNVCLAHIEETSEGSRTWAMWFDVLQVLDVICCCCVLFPIVWSIKKLRESADGDETTTRTITRMREFRTFYMVVVAYIYFTRIVLIMVDNAVSYDKAWIAKAGAEVIAAVFYIYCGVRFRPRPNRPYEVLQRVEMSAETELQESVK